MFKMKIEDAIKIHNNISFGGSCENKDDFSNLLIDDLGNMFDTYIPLGKDLVIDDSRITLCLKGDHENYDIESLKGRILTGVIL